MTLLRHRKSPFFFKKKKAKYKTYLSRPAFRTSTMKRGNSKAKQIINRKTVAKQQNGKQIPTQKKPEVKNKKPGQNHLKTFNHSL